MSQVQGLFRLQQIDSEIAAGKKRLGAVIQGQKEPSELLAARERAAQAEHDLKQRRAQQRDSSLELDGLNEKARRSEKRLYSGKVTNPKELEDLQHGLEALGRRRKQLEDELLEAMIAVEEVESEAAAARDEVARLTTDWQQSAARLAEEQEELATRLNHLMGLRGEQTAVLEPRLVADYENISARHGGLAVAVLKINACQGCRLTVSAAVVKATQEGELVHCGNCGRILVAA